MRGVVRGQQRITVPAFTSSAPQLLADASPVTPSLVAVEAATWRERPVAPCALIVRSTTAEVVEPRASGAVSLAILGVAAKLRF